MIGGEEEDEEGKKTKRLEMCEDKSLGWCW
jgi:hypothetical protein